MRRAIYPGSFDPVTNGHLDVIERAAKLFDEVIVAVAVNDQKRSLFTADERTALIAGAVGGWKNVRVSWFDGLLVEFAAAQQASAVVRGLRAVSDFEFEFQMALMNRKLDEHIETIGSIVGAKLCTTWLMIAPPLPRAARGSRPVET